MIRNLSMDLTHGSQQPGLNAMPHSRLILTMMFCCHGLIPVSSMGEPWWPPFPVLLARQLAIMNVPTVLSELFQFERHGLVPRPPSLVLVGRRHALRGAACHVYMALPVVSVAPLYDSLTGRATVPELPSRSDGSTFQEYVS
mmetsp:Transcript_165969/g.527640  ORF Transcript_165969/g.527640 Transcript_165969/m.527640 type:complete len:142 (+) Transcript_165969:470-895(+)